MKKLSFIIVMVLATGFAMAQKTTWLTQAGYGNSATITQDASVSLDANKIYATQNGSWNTLTTGQLGKDNYIELSQGGDNNSAKMVQTTLLSATDQNSALINQGGISDKADLTQKGSTATLFGITSLDLSNNKSVATQSGTYGSFILNQGGPTTGLSTAIKPVNNSYLTQSGYGNTADLNQLGKTNYSEISQTATGNWNTADLLQENPILDGSTDISNSWQYGSNSTVNILQNETSLLLGNSEQTANSYQSGLSNTTKIEQISHDVQKVSATEEGTYDILTVNQHN